MTQTCSSSSPASSSSQPAPSAFTYTLQPPSHESGWPSPSLDWTTHDSFQQPPPHVTPSSERSYFSLSPVTPPPVSSPPEWPAPSQLNNGWPDIKLEPLHSAEGDTTNLWQQSSLSEEVKRLSPRRPDFSGNDRDDGVDQTPSSSSYIMQQQSTYQQDQYAPSNLQPTGYPSMASIYPTGLGSNFPDFNAYNPHYPAQPYATPFPTSEPATDPWQRNDLGHVGPQEFAQVRKNPLCRSDDLSANILRHTGTPRIQAHPSCDPSHPSCRSPGPLGLWPAVPLHCRLRQLGRRLSVRKDTGRPRRRLHEVRRKPSVGRRPRAQARPGVQRR